MTIVPTNPMPVDGRLYTNITPFTVRNNATYLIILEDMRQYINDKLVPFINTNIGNLDLAWVTLTQELIESWNVQSAALIAEVTEAVEGIGTSVADAQAAQVAAEAAATLAEQFASQAEEIQDSAIATIGGDENSQTRTLFDGLYAGLGAFTTLSDVLTSGRLSPETLDDRFDALDTEKADITFVTDGFTPLNTLGVALKASAGTLSDLQNAINLAAASQVPLYIAGSYEISSPVTVPDNIDIIGRGNVTIKQTSPLTAHIIVANVSNVRISGLTLVGHGNDYINSDTVYGATGIKLMGTNGRVTIENCVMSRISGSGVFVSTSATAHVVISNCLMTGAGLSTIGTGNYSGGIVVQDGITDVFIDGNDISEFSQGIGIGHGSARVSVTNNRLHDTAEHGAYFATSDSYFISGNHFYNNGLLGFKIQNGKAGYVCRNAVITGNTVDNSGSNSIMITNAIADVMFIQNVVIADNIVNDSGDTGIRIDNVNGIKIVDNTVNGARFGIRLFKSKLVQIVNNTVKETERTGVLIDNSTFVKLSLNTLLNLGILGPEKVGVIVSGIVEALTIEENYVDYDKTAQSDGLLLGAGNYTRVRILNNYFRGANWGMRTAAAASAIIDWRNNRAVGGVGTIDGAPAIVPLLPNVTVADATATAELNKIKQILRGQQDAR